MAKKNPGDGLGYTAAEWNRHEDAAEERASRELGSPSGRQSRIWTGTTIKVKNSSGSDRRRADVLKVDAALLPSVWTMPLIGEGKHSSLWFDGVECDGPDSLVAVLSNYAKEDEIVDAYVSGVAVAWVAVTDVDHQYAITPNSGFILGSTHYEGGYRILNKPAGTGQKFCTILLHREPRMHHGGQILSGAVGSPFSTATVPAGGMVPGCGSDALPDNVAGSGTTSIENNGFTALNNGALWCRHPGCYLMGFHGSISYSATDVPPRGGALQVELYVAPDTASAPGTGTGYRGRRRHNPERDNYNTFTDPVNEENIAIQGRVNLDADNVVSVVNSGAYAIEVTYGHLWGIRLGAKVN